MYILIGILAGVSIVISRITNAALSDRIGLYQSTCYNYITGLSLSLLVLLILNEPWPVSEGQAIFSGVNIFAYFGGLLGLATIVLSNITVPKLPAFTLSLLIFISQLFTGILLDYFLYDTMSIGKLVGGVFLAAGLLVYQRGKTE